MSTDERLARARKPSRDALRLHPFYKGKIQTMAKCPVRNLADFAVWYTPGVAAPSRAIARDPDLVYEHTNKGNTVAVVSDGSRVLGLGNIGPEASLPVMEGKALLFKYLGGVDAVPVCLAAHDPDAIVAVVKAIEPGFGGINLEDIAQPKCFRILDQLRAEVGIPVWHDDQQGSATVLLAALLNAIHMTRRKLDSIRIAMIGMGAANVAVYRLLKAYGVDVKAIVACDTQGILNPNRSDIQVQRAEFPDKWQVCHETNRDGRRGGIREALRDMDVCIAFSTPGPDLIRPDWIRGMAPEPIVFACANPVPEIWPWQARDAGAAIVCTGRGDFANQLNNSLGFPGIFRGVLDVRARTITDGMAIRAAETLATFARERGMDAQSILPRMDEWEVYVRVAVATGLKAQDDNVARIERSQSELRERARHVILKARESTELLQKAQIIPPPPLPEDDS